MTDASRRRDGRTYTILIPFWQMADASGRRGGRTYTILIPFWQMTDASGRRGGRTSHNREKGGEEWGRDTGLHDNHGMTSPERRVRCFERS